ncbi:Uncharacterized membrane protein [Rhodospirillales bacterium URHD0017]|nr:Uncharacterized membrane protein [Rhodospirillales bacterium URHD0017]
MSWHDRYRLNEFVRSSFWLFPSLSIGLAWLAAKLILWFVPVPEWPRFDDADVEGMRVSMAAFASSMLTFVVYAVSALLLAVQLASGQITPRLIRITFSRWQMKFATSTFVFAFGVTMVALANMTEQLRHPLVIVLAIVGNVGSVLVFFWFVQQVGLGLRPVAVLQQIFGDGRAAMDSVYVHDFDSAIPEGAAVDELAGREGRIVRRIGPSGTFLAFGSRDLVALGRRAGCAIELIPQVGDFVSTDDPLARIYPADAAIGDEAVNAVVAFGAERTMRQDPMFAFRIMVDVAARALSPAVNDPTTAVLALDQIHRLLRYAASKNLDNAHLRDSAGALRLVFPTPNWSDIVDLAVTEVRQYGASSTQVARRLRAMLEHLIDRLPDVRRGTLRLELDLLERAVARNFVEGEDRRRANIGDFQGLGGSSVRTDL